jgi:hypothetical protein
MNCAEYRGILIDAARGLDDEAALEHARDCAECGRVYRNQRTLTGALTAMAKGEQAEPSAGLEFALLSHFRPSRAKTLPRRWAAVMVAGAMAASVMLLVFFRGNDKPPQVGQVARATLRAPVQSASVSEPLPPAKRRKVTRRRARVPQQEPDEQVFFLIPYVEPLMPTERAEVVRVDMPVSALAGLGIPITGADPNRRLTADLILGENGLAHAVRVVR